MHLRIHALERHSVANGPGLRYVVWFQGCTLGCPGCFNPATHDGGAGELVDTDALAADIQSTSPVLEGLTISGGEPFQQPAALLDLLQRTSGTGLSRLVFSGYTKAETEALPLGPQILAHIDVLVAGRYESAQRTGEALLGSANQTVHFLTARYGPHDLRAVPSREWILHADGSVTSSGINPRRLRPA